MRLVGRSPRVVLRLAWPLYRLHPDGEILQERLQAVIRNPEELAHIVVPRAVRPQLFAAVGVHHARAFHDNSPRAIPFGSNGNAPAVFEGEPCSLFHIGKGRIGLGDECFWNLLWWSLSWNSGRLRSLPRLCPQPFQFFLEYRSRMLAPTLASDDIFKLSDSLADS